ncbi:MAG TPA: ORF6N domain-containing protein [Verrucomicrobiae bacterium]|nr:ORF6N domain-containing protein [Verrucomicrobiae bacterium]
MNKPMQRAMISIEGVIPSIRVIRGQKVLLDVDLAALYDVPTGQLNRAVKRNRTRFPDDFMFQLTQKDMDVLKCQFGISSSGHGGRRRSKPYAFTEQGVAMLSSVLNTERAVRVNIAIMRAFVKLREVLTTNEELARKFEALEKRVGDHDEQIAEILDAIREMLSPGPLTKGEIGFHVKQRGDRNSLQRAKK